MSMTRILRKQVPCFAALLVSLACAQEPAAPESDPVDSPSLDTETSDRPDTDVAAPLPDGAEAFESIFEAWIVITTHPDELHKHTEVLGEEGQVLLEMDTWLDSLQLRFPTRGDGWEEQVLPLSPPLEVLPLDEATNRLAMYVYLALDRVEGRAGVRAFDDPGCDVIGDIPGIGDIQCMLGCCALHDACYDLFDCTALSWLGVESPSCSACNVMVVGCIFASCVLDIDLAFGAQCYDHRCDQFFECDGETCDCSSPCATVGGSSCGNTFCELAEPRSCVDCRGDLRTPGCNTCGDVHLRTPDGLSYAFQAAGEFLLLQSEDDEVELQARMEPVQGSEVASVTTAAVLRLGDDQLGFYVDRDPILEINGVPEAETNGLVTLSGGGRVHIVDTGGRASFVIEGPNGLLASVWARGSFLDLGVEQDPAIVRIFSGVLGNLNQDPGDDLQLRDGTEMVRPVHFDALYDLFALDWRIAQDDSLFDYLPGTSTATYTLLDFPNRPITLASIAAADPDLAATAVAACEDAGLSHPILLRDCALDLALTGDSAFIGSALRATEPAEELEVAWPVYLDDWTQEGEPSAGMWEVAADGRSVEQQLNQDPTFFVSRQTYLDVIIRGGFSVATGHGDQEGDFIGFVTSFRAPVAADGDAPDAFDFVLFDWKQADQLFDSRFGPAGFTLARVQGVFPASPDTNRALWSHIGAGIDVLAADHDAAGWQDGVVHQFEVLWTSTRLRIEVDGITIFDVVDTFEEGRFGFYNFSQSDVTYLDFEVEDVPPTP